jgi:hypothetical protein
MQLITLAKLKYSPVMHDKLYLKNTPSLHNTSNLLSDRMEVRAKYVINFIKNDKTILLHINYTFRHLNSKTLINHDNQKH